MKAIMLSLVLVVFASQAIAQKFTVASPDGKLKLEVSVGENPMVDFIKRATSY